MKYLIAYVTYYYGGPVSPPQNEIIDMPPHKWAEEQEEYLDSCRDYGGNRAKVVVTMVHKIED